MRVLRAVVETLERGNVPFCLIGAGALAAHGVSRSTVDLDLLSLDSRVLRRPFWLPVQTAGIEIELRPGDAEDPLAGVVRFSGEGSRPVDLIAGRGGWQAPIPLRARPLSFAGMTLPVATGGDLVLLKLWAGGHQDLWDIRQLLAGPDGTAIRKAVEVNLSTLPADCAERWRSVIVP